jgi:hypothetical protein
MVYIGEASDLHRRVQRVLTPSKSGKKSDTNFRLHQLFEQASAAGSRVLLETASFDGFVINGIPFSPSTISNEFVRCAIESVLVRLNEQNKEGQKLLNKSLRDRHFQKMLQQLQALPPSKAIPLLQEVLSKHPHILDREPQKERAKD